MRVFLLLKMLSILKLFQYIFCTRSFVFVRVKLVEKSVQIQQSSNQQATIHTKIHIKMDTAGKVSLVFFSLKVVEFCNDKNLVNDS